MTPYAKNLTARATIAAGYARALFELAVGKGADAELLAARAGLAPQELADQDKRISWTRYMALMHAAKELTGDDALALHFGESFDMADLSIVGLIAQSCETAAEGFAQIDRYHRLIVDIPVDDPRGRRLVLVREKGKSWLKDTRSDPNTFPELTESSFARMVCMARRSPATTEIAKAIHFTHAEPAYRAEYDRIFGVPLVFASDRNAMLLGSDAWMSEKASQPSRYVFGILSAHADALLESLKASTTTRARVEALLMAVLHTGETDMETIARRLGLGRQTLLRRLKDEGTTYEKVLDELRCRLALDYLGARKVSVNETAYLVGYSDAAAFSRAFRRWTGTSPGSKRG